jgi:hypothetical protein
MRISCRHFVKQYLIFEAEIQLMLILCIILDKPSFFQYLQPVWHTVFWSTLLYVVGAAHWLIR